MIHATNITKYFNRGSSNEVLALNDINLHIKEGEFVTLIGSNGAGKSTLLEALAGTFFVDQGNLEMNGQNVTTWPEYRRAGLIARVFQDPLMGTCAEATIEQNLALASKRGQKRGLCFGVKSTQRNMLQSRLAALNLGLEERLEDKTGFLSGGQRQALTLLMATLVRPQVLLLDEHTAALDPKTANQIMSLTEGIVTQHALTTLMVTHNMGQAIHYGNRLIMLHQGQIILDLQGEEKASLSIDELIKRFYEASGCEMASDKALLA